MCRLCGVKLDDRKELKQRDIQVDTATERRQCRLLFNLPYTLLFPFIRRIQFVTVFTVCGSEPWKTIQTPTSEPFQQDYFWIASFSFCSSIWFLYGLVFLDTEQWLLHLLLWLYPSNRYRIWILEKEKRRAGEHIWCLYYTQSVSTLVECVHTVY